MAIAAAFGLAACGFGEEGVSVAENEPDHGGAVLFATHCSGCHTLSAAGTQGSGNRGLRTQGPNLNQRTETYEELSSRSRTAVSPARSCRRTSSSAKKAKAVARFVAKYAGGEAEESPRPGAASP